MHVRLDAILRILEVYEGNWRAMAGNVDTSDEYDYEYVADQIPTISGIIQGLLDGTNVGLIGKTWVTGAHSYEGIHLDPRESDPIVDILRDWVDRHPDEAGQPIKSVQIDGVPTTVSMARILEEMEAGTPSGKAEYSRLVQLTIDLLSRGKIGTEES